ncbi:MAG: hypothetical protein HYU66_01960 [Armatimonadetes bacterium]|nr:hypothetical protein [Armatimonadota bacterium]
MIATALGERAQLALDTIAGRSCRGIPTWLLNVMEHRQLERLAGAETGEYQREPERVYLAFEHAIGCCFLDQWIPTNPLSMGDHGYEGAARGATTGAEQVVVDGLVIDSPEAVCEHLERFEFPRLARAAEGFDEDRRVAEILAGERAQQTLLGPDILKTGYGFIGFPALHYFHYGYVNYLMALALYPEVLERHFALQADVLVRNNRAAARAYATGELPPLYRLDHDMADSRGMLANIATLDRIWLPHFARSLEPVVQADVRLIWHCDGNLMALVPRLLEVGIRGFQGFQYEDGMDYERICAMKARDGSDLFIIAGVSVTTTLPLGTPADVKRQLDWLVAAGPRQGLCLGGSSSICPGVPWENLRTFVDGLHYYREHGRAV